MPDLPRPVPSPDWVDRLKLRRLGAAAGGVAAAVVVATVAFVAWRGAPPPPEMNLPRAGSAGDPGVATTEPGSAGSPPEAAGAGASSAGAGANPPGAGADTLVHAAGAVVRPGLYRVAAGARVADVLDAAGGPTPEADIDQINLAARVTDGERLYVARKGEAPPAGGVPAGGPAGGSGGDGGRPVDLNTATVEQLDTLPGVGPSTAQAIVEYRRQKGRFRSVEDLLDVPGIGPAKLAQLRPRVRT